MDSELLPCRVRDAYNICEKTNAPKFLGFLKPEEAAVAVDVLKPLGASFEFFGGYEGAERVMLALKPDWCEGPQYPISSFTFKYRVGDTLCHRDFLGSLMALGITRESVGDILVGEGRAVVFVTNEIARFVSTQLEKIGRVGVEITEGYLPPLPTLSQKLALSDTVASMRLDCVVAALGGFSRSVACEKIERGEVSVNSVCCDKASKVVASGDKVTVKHKGRFEIASADSYSKKGRIILKYYKYV